MLNIKDKYTLSTKKSSVCFLAMSQLKFVQIQKVRSVLKTTGSENSTLSLLLIFGQVEAEIIEVKDSRGHFQFLHFCARVFPVLSVRITLLDFQNSIGHLAILSMIFSKQMTQVLTKNTKEIDI